MKKSMMFGLMCAAVGICGAARGVTVVIPLGDGCDTLAYSVNGGSAVEVSLAGDSYKGAQFLELELGHNGAYVVELKKGSEVVKSFDWVVTDEEFDMSKSGTVEAMLDTREEKTIAGTTTETITYSGDGWGEGGSGVTVGYLLDGVAAKTLKEAADSGAFEWKPTVNGRYVFSHAVTDGSTETAVFVVNGLPGGEGDPWEIGAGVTAYVKDRVLYLNGKGEVTEFGGDGAPWAGYGEVLTGIGPLSRAVTVPASVAATLPISVAGGTPTPMPPTGAVTSWEALTNAVATVESGAEIAVGADITEAGGELVVPAGKAVTIKLYGKTVSCGRVTVGGALTVGDAEDSVGRIVASNGAKVAKGGSVTLLGGPMRGTFTTLSPGLILLFR